MTVTTAGLSAARAVAVLRDTQQPGRGNRLAALLAPPELALGQPGERIVGIGERTPGGSGPAHEMTGRPVRLRRLLGVVEGQG